MFRAKVLLLSWSFIIASTFSFGFNYNQGLSDSNTEQSQLDTRIAEIAKLIDTEPDSALFLASLELEKEQDANNFSNQLKLLLFQRGIYRSKE